MLARTAARPLAERLLSPLPDTAAPSVSTPIRSADPCASCRRQPGPGPAGWLEGLPGLGLLSETIGDDNGDGGIVSETEMTAAHFNVLAQRALRQQRCAPVDDGIAAAVHRCRRDVWRWVAPTDQGTPVCEDRAHRVRSTSRQVDGVNAAEAPPDQAHRAVLVRGYEKLIETVGDVATEAAVDAEAPSVAAVSEAINEPAK